MTLLPRFGFWIRRTPSLFQSSVYQAPLKNTPNFKATPLSCLSLVKVDYEKNSLFLQKRSYAKGKNKGKGKNTGISISEDEMAEIIDVGTMNEKFESTLEQLKEDFVKNLSLRTSLGAIESIPVNFEGDKYPISEIAQVVRKSSSSIIINANAFPQAINDIKNALETSGMNLNPQQDGTTLYVTIPKVTKDYREGLSKNAKVLCDKCKVTLRNIQNKYIKDADEMKGKTDDDLIFATKSKIKEFCADRSKEVDNILQTKNKELLQLKD